MPQRHVTRTEVGRPDRHAAPARSASAARAHDTGDVSWVIDLAVAPASMRMRDSADASRRYALVGLSLLTAALWMFNIATLVAGTNS